MVSHMDHGGDNERSGIVQCKKNNSAETESCNVKINCDLYGRKINFTKSKTLVWLVSRPAEKLV